MKYACWMILPLALVGLGCSGDGMAPVDMIQLPDLSPPPYPTGPYGSTVGATLPNFTFQGYYSPTSTTVLASTQPFGTVTFDQIRLSGAKTALIHLAAVW